MLAHQLWPRTRPHPGGCHRNHRGLVSSTKGSCSSACSRATAQQADGRRATASAAAAAAAAQQQALPIHGPLPQYGGRCTRCGGAHALPCTPAAVEAMQALLATICEHQRLDCFESASTSSSGSSGSSEHSSSGSSGPPSAPPDPRFGLQYLFTAGPGRMLGVLLAQDAAGAVHTLRAFSGQITESWHIEGWVGPVAGIINTSPAYTRTRRVIERLSVRIQQLQQQQDNGDVASKQARRQQGVHTSFARAQQQLLKRRRRALSHHLLQQIQGSYLTPAAAGRQRTQPQQLGRGLAQQQGLQQAAPPEQQQQGQQHQEQPLSLLDVYLAYRQQHDLALPVTRLGQRFVGMPAGAGDCCAPKLLHAAAQRGLRPLSLCEVWFGSVPGTATPAKQGRQAVVAGPHTPAALGASRQHCRLYGPCDKCVALLGTMLCDQV